MSTSRNCFRFGLLFLAVFVISVIAAPDEGVASPAQVETNGKLIKKPLHKMHSKNNNCVVSV